MSRRVDQLLSSLGYCTRRGARNLCADERVTIDGQPVKDASNRVIANRICVDGKPLEYPDGLFIMLHKPLGLVCNHDSREGTRIYDILPQRWQRRNPQLTSIGRLDKHTSGLLLLTDIGSLVHRLTAPKHAIAKVYEVTLDGTLGEEAVAAFSKGIILNGEDLPTLPARLRILEMNRVEVTLHEGRYHQVRRMLAAVGLHVKALKRTRFGEWALEELPVGAWTPLRLPNLL